MMIDQSDLREIYCSYLGTRKKLNRRDCPPPQDIAGSFESSASIRLKRRIVDHISDCAMCREEFMILLKHQEAHWGDSQECRSRSSWLRNTLRKKMLYAFSWQGAALIVSLTFVITSFFVIRHADNPATRQAEMTEMSLISPENDSVLAAPFLFKWRSKAGSEYCILSLYEESLKPIWTSKEIRDTFLFLPVETAAKLAPGRGYYWIITSYVNGVATGESRLGRFFVGR